MGGRGSSSTSSSTRIGTPEGNALVLERLNKIADEAVPSSGFVSVGQRERAADARAAANLVGTDRLAEIYKDPNIQTIASEYAKWSNTTFSENVTSRNLANLAEGHNKPLGMSETAFETLQQLWNQAQKQGFTAREVGAAMSFQIWLRPSVGLSVKTKGRS